MEKVKLPRGVVEAIDFYRNDGYSNREILGEIDVPFKDSAGEVITTFVNNLDSGNFDLLLSALVNGYEVEEPLEDKVREYYVKQRMSEIDGTHDSSYFAIKKTLDLLGIKIGGVNA